MGSFNHPLTAIKAFVPAYALSSLGVVHLKSFSLQLRVVKAVFICHRGENTNKRHHNEVLKSTSRAELITVKSISSWALS